MGGALRARIVGADPVADLTLALWAVRSGSDVPLSWVRRKGLLSQLRDWTGTVPLRKPAEACELDILTSPSGVVLSTLASGVPSVLYPEAAILADFGAMVEIKDDGETGRLQSNRNVEKIRVQHRQNKNVFWICRSDGAWIRAGHAGGLRRIVDRDRFDVKELVCLA